MRSDRDLWEDEQQARAEDHQIRVTRFRRSNPWRDPHIALDQHIEDLGAEIAALEDELASKRAMLARAQRRVADPLGLETDQAGRNPEDAVWLAPELRDARDGITREPINVRVEVPE